MSRDADDMVMIASLDQLFYWGPLTPLLQGWFDRWAYRGHAFTAQATFDGVSVALLYHVHSDQRHQQKVA